jgi:hypothetical protein
MRMPRGQGSVEIFLCGVVSRGEERTTDGLVLPFSIACDPGDVRTSPCPVTSPLTFDLGRIIFRISLVFISILKYYWLSWYTVLKHVYLSILK